MQYICKIDMLHWMIGRSHKICRKEGNMIKDYEDFKKRRNHEKCSAFLSIRKVQC